MSAARLHEGTVIGVLGAGTMGAGIAQVAAVNGHPVILADSRVAALEDARARLTRVFHREVEKGRMSGEEADVAMGRLSFAPVDGDSLPMFAHCGLVVEAVVERLEVKQAVFRALEAVVDGDSVLATNTSSLPVTSIAAACGSAGRVVGMHFFNPAPVMPLVEVVPGIATDAGTTRSVRALMERWGKVPVVADDTPGFIVNRIARPYYGESLRILEEGIADVATIDHALRETGGFRMGPFELMDFIGNDVNFAVTHSVWEAFFHEPRYTPSLTQQRLVEAGFLGRKSGRGFYRYGDGVVAPEPRRDPELAAAVVERVLSMLVNEAAHALHMRVASAADIELAMMRGVNYPKGLLAWGDEYGVDRIMARMEALRDEYQEDRYRVSPLLRRVVRDGTRLLP